MSNNREGFYTEDNCDQCFSPERFDQGSEFGQQSHCGKRPPCPPCPCWQCCQCPPWQCERRQQPRHCDTDDNNWWIFILLFFFGC